MKNIFWMTLCAFLFACSSGTEQKTKTSAENLNDYTQNRPDVSGKLIYFKDSRTNICFAFMWSGGFNGGMGLSTVPCEKVEKLLDPKLEVK